MRKRRWLGIALLVMTAPAAFFFVSNLYFLASPYADSRKGELITSTLATLEMRRSGGGLVDLWYYMRPRSKPSQVVIDPAPPMEVELSIWQSMPPCAAQDYSVTVEPPEKATISDIKFATEMVEKLAWRDAMFWKRHHEDQMRAEAISVIGLAAIDACIRGTPFYDSCSEKLRQYAPSEADLIERLVERYVLSQQGGQTCWQRPIFEVTNPGL